MFSIFMFSPLHILQRCLGLPLWQICWAPPDTPRSGHHRVTILLGTVIAQNSGVFHGHIQCFRSNVDRPYMYTATYPYWSTGPLASLASPAIPVRGLLSLWRWAISIIPIFVLHSRFYLLQKRVTSVSSSITVLANVAKWFWMAPENVGGIIRKYVTIVALTT